MPRKIRCPNPDCGAACTLPDDKAGKQVRCGKCNKPFRAPPLETDLPKAQTVGRYEIRVRLGSGSFGTVYKAFDPQLQREVALKVLRPEALSSPQAVERFLREARAAARMLHPNIVPVFDAGQDGKQSFIVSAFIDGRTLAEAIPRGGMEPVQAATLVAQLTDALAYAHGQGVLHRDIKPGNVMLDGKGHLYLTDFGLAAWTGQDGTRLTHEGAVLGTPAFMSPEQASGDIRHIGPGADVYSAGMVLYQLLTGRLAFEGHLANVIFATLHTPPPPPSQHRSGLDPALEAICLHALAKQASGRQASAAQFCDELRCWIARQPMAALPVDAPGTGPAPLALWPSDANSVAKTIPGAKAPSTADPARSKPASARKDQTPGQEEEILDAVAVEEPNRTRPGKKTDQAPLQRRKKGITFILVGVILLVCLLLLLLAGAGAVVLILFLEPGPTTRSNPSFPAIPPLKKEAPFLPKAADAPFPPK
jgi:serine/threonine protein kinase